MLGGTFYLTRNAPIDSRPLEVDSLLCVGKIVTDLSALGRCHSLLSPWRYITCIHAAVAFGFNDLRVARARNEKPGHQGRVFALRAVTQAA